MHDPSHTDLEVMEDGAFAVWRLLFQMTTKNFPCERARSFSMWSGWGEIGEHKLLFRPNRVKPWRPGRLVVLQILVLLVKAHLEDRLEAVRHDPRVIRILEHREM